MKLSSNKNGTVGGVDASAARTPFAFLVFMLFLSMAKPAFGFTTVGSTATPLSHHPTTTKGTSSTFRYPISISRATSHVGRSSTTVLYNAKVLPLAYATSSFCLVAKAFANTAYMQTTVAEKLVLLSTALLALLNFSPTDNALLAGAKKAYKNTEPSSAGKAKQERQAAITFRKVVRIKIIGQVLGLVRMATSKTSFGLMRGCALLMAANIFFYVMGGGRSYHDSDGKWHPMSDAATNKGLVVHIVLAALSLVAASTNPIGDQAQKFTILAGIYTAGAIGGILEGMANNFSKERV